MMAARQFPDSAPGSAPRRRTFGNTEGRGGSLVQSRRCHVDSPKARPAAGRSAAMFAAGLLLAIGIFGLWAITTARYRPYAWTSAPLAVQSERTTRGPRRSAAQAPAETPVASKAPLPRYSDDRPTGSQATDLGLIATNIFAGHPENSMALLLDVQADRYVLLFLGDRWGEYEVISIATHWVQLRRAGADHWVGYVERRNARQPSGQAGAQAAFPQEVQRAPHPTGPTVTYKWLFGRINRMGELEEHLKPTRTDKGLQVGQVTLGFRRIGMRVGDVVVHAGNRSVRSVDDIRDGLQSASTPGGQGSITVLRNGRQMKLDFNVR